MKQEIYLSLTKYEILIERTLSNGLSPRNISYHSAYRNYANTLSGFNIKKDDPEEQFFKLKMYLVRALRALIKKKLPSEQKKILHSLIELANAAISLTHIDDIIDRALIVSK